MHELESGLIGIRELAIRLAISARSVWRIIERGELRVTRIGRRTLISKAEIAKWLAGHETPTPGAKPPKIHAFKRQNAT